MERTNCTLILVCASESCSVADVVSNFRNKFQQSQRDFGHQKNFFFFVCRCSVFLINSSVPTLLLKLLLDEWEVVGAFGFFFFMSVARHVEGCGICRILCPFHFEVAGLIQFHAASKSKVLSVCWNSPPRSLVAFLLTMLAQFWW